MSWPKNLSPEYIEKKAKQSERKVLVRTLTAKGWRSTGDVPYIIGRALHKSTGPIESRMRATLDAVLMREGVAYREAHVKKVDERKTFVSPDLIEKLTVEIKAAMTEARASDRRTVRGCDHSHLRRES